MKLFFQGTSITIVTSNVMSKENVVADSWEDADADPVKELMEKVEKVKLLQRKKEKKEAFFEKVKAEESNGFVPKLQADDGLGPVVDEPKRVFLRRPKDGFTAENVVESSSSSGVSPENPPTSRGRTHYKSNQKEQKQPAPTYEERQAAYQAARNRILGTEYKPDNQEIKEIKFIDRSKSPETLKMTHKNMADHYGEELSRELMQQPLEAVTPLDSQFVPDFSQPPPCMNQPDGCGPYPGPRGFPMIPPNYLQHHQQPFIENHFYMQMSGQIPVQYPNQGQVPSYLPQEQEPDAVSSSSQGFVGDQSYYCSQPGQQQINNLPNMAYPPPTFSPQSQQNQQIVNSMNVPPIFQMQHQNSRAMNQYQINDGMGRGSNVSVRGPSHGGGVGRGQNRQQGMYQNSGTPPMKPPPLMSHTHDTNLNRNGGNGQRTKTSIKAT
uniref:SUZ domain-containing protein n=1 Tax=Caenorhabditis tropicalis TaxID=1561998 RepID=A0A1I7UYV3_9PELO